MSSANTRKKNKKKRRRVSRTVIFVSAAVGAFFAVMGAMMLPSVTSVILFAGSALLIATLFQLKRRSLGAVVRLIGFGCLVILAGIAFNSLFVCVGWDVLAPDATAADLSGRELENLRGVERLHNLRQADFSDNRLSSADELASLSRLSYVDLTGNALDEESYARLSRALPGCAILCEVPDSETAFLDLSGKALPSLGTLEAVFAGRPALTGVNCADSSLTESDITALSVRFPNIHFLCMIEAGGQRFLSDAKSISLETPQSGSLIDSLAAFENLTELELTDTPLNVISAIHTAYPKVALSFTWQGLRIGPDTTELTLDASHTASLDELVALATCAPALTRFDLSAQNLAVDEMNALRAARPDVRFLFTLDVFGRRLSSETTVLDFGQIAIADDQVEELAALLALMPDLAEVDMYASSLSDASHDRLFDGFPKVFFGWTLTVDTYTIRTDQTAFSTNKAPSPPYYDENDFACLRYCTRLEALDLGHNHIQDISFLRSHPQLKVLILADNRITDISPLEDLMELQYAELFMNHIADFSPLANHTKLLDLNLYSNLSPERLTPQDVTPLLSCTSLQRCWLSYNSINSGQRRQLREGLPNCEFDFTAKEATDHGWREHPRYFVMREGMLSGVFVPFDN